MKDEASETGKSASILHEVSTKSMTCCLFVLHFTTLYPVQRRKTNIRGKNTVTIKLPLYRTEP